MAIRLSPRRAIAPDREPALLAVRCPRMISSDNNCMSIDVHLAGDLIGFSAGSIVSVLFLGLTLRAARLPGTPLANIALALCALAWNLGGLAKAANTVLGAAFPAGGVNWAAAVMFTGMWLWPLPVLAIWRHHSTRRWQKFGCDLLQAIGSLAAAAMIVLHSWPDGPGLIGISFQDFIGFEKQLFSGYGFALLAFGTAILVHDRPKTRAVWIAYVMILLGLFGSALALFLHQALGLGPSFDTVFATLSKKSAMLVLFGSFFLFARFRFADLLIRYSLRILLASGFAMCLMAQTQSPLWSALAAHTASPAATQLFILSALAAGLILCFAVLERALMRGLTRWLFATPDYRAATQHFTATLDALHEETAIATAAEGAVRSLLDLREARLLPLDRASALASLPGLATGEIIALSPCDPLVRALPVREVELLVPVCSAGRLTHAFAIAPGQARRALVTHEIDFLRSVAAQISRRFDTLRSEREMIERRSREAVLLQQITEAELRALRAQINPHFLFNSLNTVADLVVTDPTRAELMTLRLAQVFRHVLAHSARPLTSIREEIDFVRTYLFIEEARFGDRLRVDIDISPEVAAHKIPSLILQPVVENALKHGLAPKLGPGLLRIGATARDEHVCLTVEDDGVGPAPATPARLASATATPRTGGVGLKNVAARLHTLYRDRAGIRLEPRAAGGSLVTILIPWPAANETNA